MQEPTVEPVTGKPKIIVRCRECGTRIYPRRSPAGPMAIVCDCAQEQIEKALAGVAILEVLPAEK